MSFDFSENKTVKGIDAVPDQFRPLYEEDKAAPGTFKLKETPEVKGAVEALVGSANALKAERQITKDLKTKVVDLAPLSSFGRTPEEIAAAVDSKIKELQSKNVDVEKIRAEVAKAAQGDVTKREERIKTLEKQIDDLLVDEEIAKAAARHGTTPELLRPFVRERVKTVEVDGRRQPRILDEKTGETRFSASGAMTINELVEELKGHATFGKIFTSTAKAGSGAAPSGAGSRQTASTQRQRSSVEKIAAGLARRQ